MVNECLTFVSPRRTWVSASPQTIRTLSDGATWRFAARRSYGLRHRPTSHAAIDPRRFGDAPSNRSAQHRAVLRACRRARRLPVRWHSDACRDKRARRYRLWQQIVMTEKRQYIPRSRHNPKILWIDDAEIVGDRIT